jgi:hypothetical protein
MLNATPSFLLIGGGRKREMKEKRVCCLEEEGTTPLYAHGVAEDLGYGRRRCSPFRLGVFG